MRLIEEQIQRIRELQKSTQPVTPPLPQKQRYLYEPGKMPEQPLKPPEKVATEETEKPSLHRQCGHYYDTQLSRIGQEENNECLTEEEYIQRLNRTVETFDALVVSLGQKRENSPYNGFISEWKVGFCATRFFSFSGKLKMGLKSSQFYVLKKCSSKFNCLVYEMLFIRKLKPSLNVQSDAINAKLFT